MVQPFTTSDPDIRKLLEISGELFDIAGATSLLHWDQETYMPPRGIIHRSRQLATLSAIYHERLTDNKVGELLKKLEGKGTTETDKALIREMNREYNKATKIPEKLVKDLSVATSVGLETWKQARKENDFKLFRDSLQRIIDLKIEQTNLIGYKDSPYDALLDDYEPELLSKNLQSIFQLLRTEITQVLKKHKHKKTKQVLRRQKYSKTKMIKITEKMLEKIGYDFEAGRQDLSAHPFTINFGHSDVRVTNRYIPTDLASSIFSAVHEGGHGLYELGISDILANTLLAGGTSLGIHESQSRLWENFIGRSLEFWKYWAPYFKKDAKEIYMEVNQVLPGFIRVDADEVTYNLHIIIRFEIEKALIEQKINVKDLPEIWNAKYQELLGLTPPDAALGVLQDIHWSQGSIGYFPTYTLGNLYAAQFWNKLTVDIPNTKSHIESGNFEPILLWLRKNIHQYGTIFRAKDLVTKVTGEKLNPKHFTDYLYSKFCYDEYS